MTGEDETMAGVDATPTMELPPVGDSPTLAGAMPSAPDGYVLDDTTPSEAAVGESGAEPKGARRVDPLGFTWRARLVGIVVALGLVASGLWGAVWADRQVTESTCAGIAQQWAAAVSGLPELETRGAAVLQLAWSDSVELGTVGYPLSLNAPGLVKAVQDGLAAAKAVASSGMPTCTDSGDIGSARAALGGAQAAADTLGKAVDALGADIDRYRLGVLCQAAATAANGAVAEWAKMVQAAKGALDTANATTGYAASPGAADLIAPVQALVDAQPVFVDTGCKAPGDVDAIKADIAALATRTAAGQASVDALNASISDFVDAQTPAPGTPQAPPTPGKPKDVCPNGDYSGSRYDGKCGTKPKTPATPTKPGGGGGGSQPPAPKPKTKPWVTNVRWEGPTKVGAYVNDPDECGYIVTLGAGSVTGHTFTADFGSQHFSTSSARLQDAGDPWAHITPLC